MVLNDFNANFIFLFLDILFHITQNRHFHCFDKHGKRELPKLSNEEKYRS